MKYTQEQMHKKTLETVAALMMSAAETAPKGKGISTLEAFVVDREEKTALVKQMRMMGKTLGAPIYERDALNIEASPCIVLMAATNARRNIQHCGYCGAKDCMTSQKLGVPCAFSVGDLGIAIGSAVAIAATHHIDNRIMFSVGKAALAMNMFSSSAVVAYGIPLSISAKSPFFDR
ncbi:MAG: DUF2148 domain-containing protein [Bacillota bacterium]